MRVKMAATCMQIVMDGRARLLSHGMMPSEIGV